MFFGTFLEVKKTKITFSRAVDLRPFLDSSNNVIFHHSFEPIGIKLSLALDEIDTWCMHNPNELILLYFSHYSGKGVEDATKKLMKEGGYTTISRAYDDSLFDYLTVG